MYQLYLFFSILILLSAFITILSYNPIHSVFWLVMVFIQSAILSIILTYNYLGLIIIIIYVGAIAILFLFMIMMLDVLQLRTATQLNNIIPIILLLCWQVWFGLKMQIRNKVYPYTQGWKVDYESHIILFGKTIYNDLGFLLIISSFILLIAMMGTIVIILEKNNLTKKQNLNSQHHRNNSWT